MYSPLFTFIKTLYLLRLRGIEASVVAHALAVGYVRYTFGKMLKILTAVQSRTELYR